MLYRGLDVPNQKTPQAHRRERLGAQSSLTAFQEALGPLVDDVEEQVLFRSDMRVERAALQPEGLGEVLHRGPVIAPLGEQARRRSHQLGAPGARSPLDRGSVDRHALDHRAILPNDRSFGGGHAYSLGVPDRFAPASERVGLILRRLERAYPDAKIALNFSTPLELAVATILSAQSTDAKVNEVTVSLFKKYRRPEDYVAVPEEELQQDIHATGFFRQKTRALRGMCQRLLDAYGGEMPQRLADLITLPGVARKTANIIQANLFPDTARKDPDAGIAVDTHVGRVAVRLALTERGSKEAVKIEKDLMELVPKRHWPRLPYLFIEHGRRTCDAKRPRCEDCPVEPLCPSSQEAGLPDLYRTTAVRRPRPATR
jgi:endonuclease-3